MTRACTAAFALLILSGSAVAAQNYQPSVSTAKKLQGDFAVPEAPALTMLGVDASKLLRPSSVQALTSNLSSGSDNFTFIPRALAVEFSPALLLAGERLRIPEYQRKAALYRTRVSFASARDTLTKRSQFASAIRISLQDKSDLRMNKSFLRAIDSLTFLRVDSARTVNDALTKAAIPRIASQRTPVQRAAADSVTQLVAEQLRDSLGQAMTATIAAVKRAREDVQWNADVFDIALGWQGSSTDSTGSGTRGDGLSLWLTKGWGLWSAGQALVGLRGASERDTTHKLRNTGDLVARLYVGGNHAKVLVESQATGKANTGPSWLVRGGAEFEAGGALWLSLSAGWQADDGRRGRFTQSVKFHLAPPNL